MKNLVYQEKVNTREELINRIEDAAAQIKNNRAALRRITRSIRKRAAKCIEVQGLILNTWVDYHVAHPKFCRQIYYPQGSLLRLPSIYPSLRLPPFSTPLSDKTAERAESSIRPSQRVTKHDSYSDFLQDSRLDKQLKHNQQLAGFCSDSDEGQLLSIELTGSGGDRYIPEVEVISRATMRSFHND
ncbi:hypothetical protein J6590_059865 [Homalodisca vitripennis]|nr:hypothetical protein J6590_059865 [Homalodisca vitripennis]